MKLVNKDTNTFSTRKKKALYAVLDDFFLSQCTNFTCFILFTSSLSLWLLSSVSENFSQHGTTEQRRGRQRFRGWRNTSTKKTREFAPKFSHALPIETKFSSVGFLDPFIQDVAHLHTNCQLLPLYLVSMCLSLRREILKQAHLPSLSSPKWKINFTIVFWNKVSDQINQMTRRVGISSITPEWSSNWTLSRLTLLLLRVKLNPIGHGG